jgi:hypothetical protein
LGSGQGKRKHKSELIEGLRKRKAVDCKRKIEKVKKRKTINVKPFDNSNTQFASVLKGYKRKKILCSQEKRQSRQGKLKAYISSRDRIHESTISLRFRGIILRCLRLQIS